MIGEFAKELAAIRLEIAGLADAQVRADMRITISVSSNLSLMDRLAIHLSHMTDLEQSIKRIETRLDEVATKLDQ